MTIPTVTTTADFSTDDLLDIQEIVFDAADSGTSSTATFLSIEFGGAETGR